MTEIDLRNLVVKKIHSWLGLRQSDGSYQEILDIYNNHKPLARGYKIQRGDAWCAATVSAVAIALNLTDIMPTEVSCPKMVSLYQQHKLSRWEENDAYKPQIGDICLYDWQDDGKGDNRGVPDHIGIVTSVNGNDFTVTEGNLSGAVNTRKLYVNALYIRGFALPNYAWKAAQISEQEPVSYPAETSALRWETVDDVPTGYYRDNVKRLIQKGIIAGKGQKNGSVIIDMTEDMLRVLLWAERMVSKP